MGLHRNGYGPVQSSVRQPEGRCGSAGAECQAYEHELFLDNEEKYYNQLQEQGMEFIEVDTDAFAKAMIDGVLPILTDSQKKIYDAIAALA